MCRLLALFSLILVIRCGSAPVNDLAPIYSPLNDGHLDKILRPISISSLNSNSKKTLDPRIEGGISEDSLYHLTYYNKQPIFGTLRNGNYIQEVFDEKYLVISRYTNEGAAGPALMKRDKVYVMPLINPTAMYELEFETAIQFGIHKSTFKYYYSSQDPIFLIENITENTIVLLDTKLKYKLIPLTKVEGFFTF